MTLEEQLQAEREARIRAEGERDGFAKALEILAGHTPSRGRIRARPEALAWAARNPGVPMPTAPVEATDLDAPVVRMLTAAERAQRQAEAEVLATKYREEAAERRRLRQRRWVYFIRSGETGPIKIGISRDVARRKGELEREEKEKLTVLATVEGTMADERTLHQRFAEHRLHGEWFAPVPELLSHIATLGGVRS